METPIRISFQDVEESEAGAMAEELREYILEEAPEAEVSRERDDPESMDAGATLAVILSSAAVVAVAKGIQAWLERRTSSSIKLVVDSRQLEVSYLTCKQASELTRQLSGLLAVPETE